MFRRYHIGGCASCGFQPERNPGGSLPPQQFERGRSHPAHPDQPSAGPGNANRPRGNWPRSLQKEAVRLVDIRSREEFEAVRIEGAVLVLPAVMQEILGHWPRDELVVIYDHRGRQSLDAAAYFLGQGFRKCAACAAALTPGPARWTPKSRATNWNTPHEHRRRPPKTHRSRRPRPAKPGRTGRAPTPSAPPAAPPAAT